MIQAEALALRSRAAIVAKESKDNWKAAVWILERRMRKHFAASQKLEHTGKNGGPIKSEAVNTLQIMQQAAMPVEAGKAAVVDASFVADLERQVFAGESGEGEAGEMDERAGGGGESDADSLLDEIAGQVNDMMSERAIFVF